MAGGQPLCALKEGKTTKEAYREHQRAEGNRSESTEEGTRSGGPQQGPRGRTTRLTQKGRKQQREERHEGEMEQTSFMKKHIKKATDKDEKEGHKEQ